MSASYPWSVEQAHVDPRVLWEGSQHTQPIQEAAILDPVALGDGVARVVIIIQHLTFGHNLKFNELLLDIMRGTLLYVFGQATNSYLVHFLADHTFKYIG